MAKLRLGINIDHVATVRNTRNRSSTAAPDLLRAAKEAVKGGAHSITFHLREDRRHILDEDARRLRKVLRVPLNLEIAATKEMVAIASALKPKAVCLVPERRQELTTEGGLDVVKGGTKLAKVVNDLAAAGIKVSLFINPDKEQVFAAYVSGAAAVELHTGAFCEAKGSAQVRELNRIKKASKQAQALGLDVHAGHGLNFKTAALIAAITEITELNIGHFLIGEAIFVGLAQAVRKMRRVMNGARQ